MEKSAEEQRPDAVLWWHPPHIVKVLYYLPAVARIVLLPQVLPSNIPNGQVHTHADLSYANLTSQKQLYRWWLNCVYQTAFSGIQSYRSIHVFVLIRHYDSSDVKRPNHVWNLAQVWNLAWQCLRLDVTSRPFLTTVHRVKQGIWKPIQTRRIKRDLWEGGCREASNCEETRYASISWAIFIHLVLAFESREVYYIGLENENQARLSRRTVCSSRDHERED